MKIVYLDLKILKSNRTHFIQEVLKIFYMVLKIHMYFQMNGIFSMYSVAGNENDNTVFFIHVF